ncbi:MAG: hypothetical protein BGO70_15280 [Bacteroidetes bacterium 43-93]|nr:universal stress protein [Bacteroidota bacterium]OJX01141.1 MAG: hypothetical protein BGO70_15280 [Bacteroidetes bacterium 43-93]
MVEASNTIVVTTDFSANSKAGIRFAVQLAKQRNAELIILHVYQVLRASFWSDTKYQNYVDQFREIWLQELTGFVQGIFRHSNTKPANYRLAVYHSLHIVDGILAFSKENKAAFICTSTRGRSGIARVLGGTVSGLIAKSSMPLLCVPSTYRTKKIDRILYATDMENIENELKKVIEFSKFLNAEIIVAHLAFDYEHKMVPIRSIEYKVQYKWAKRDINRSIIEDLQVVIKNVRPAIVVFFTNRKDAFIEKLLTPNNAKEYFNSGKIPVLSIHKLSKK